MAFGRSSQSSAAKRARRVCSLCDRMGHNARTCISKKAVVARTESKKPTKKLSDYIPVHVGVKPTSSPHVVPLKKHETPAWDNVTVYKDAPHMQPRRETVDFAALVREANAAQEALKPHNKRNEQEFDILAEISRVNAEPVRVTPSQKISARSFLHDLKVRDHVDVASKVRESIAKPLEPIKHAHEAGKHRYYDFIDRLSLKKFAISVAVLLMIIALPFPAMGYVNKIQSDTTRIVAQSTAAFLSLQSSTVAAFSHNIDQAQYDLNDALNSFGSAEQIIDKEYKALVYVARLLPFVGSKVKSRQELLLAGHDLALGNTYLVKGLNEVSTSEDASLIDRMTTIRNHVRSAVPAYKDALAHLDNVDSFAIPTEYQASFTDFRDLFAGFITDMDNMNNVIDGVQKIMGAEGFRRYLVLFQNNHELRPTGGFVGSYAIVDVQNGKILNIEVPGGGSYDVQGQLDVYEKPPLPLQLVNSRWEFQDGNWFPDFPASAQKMAWFYQHSRDTTVDGVIAVNASVLPRLLSVLGPIDDSQYGLLLSADDVLPQLQAHVEQYDNTEENTPKAVLAGLLDEVFASMQDIKADQTMSLVTELQEALSQKEIQFYFDDAHLQSLFAEYGWTGDITSEEPNQDFLMAVQTNLGGKKSDAEMHQQLYHQAVIQDDGSIIDTVLIHREHEGSDTADFFDHPNISYVRLYVPKGAELIDAGGFTFPDEASFSVPPRWYRDDEDVARIEQDEDVHVKTGTRITHEFGKTVFGNWVVTMPGESSDVFFTYKLPFNAFDASGVSDSSRSPVFQKFLSRAVQHDTTSRYSVVFQKQSGLVSSLKHAVIYPDGWQPIWKTGSDDVSLSINGGTIEKDFVHDEVFGIVMKKSN